jgi:signal transduction histidine kinase/DNA-binding response OmpR family regulator
VVECEEDRSAWLTGFLAGRGYDVEVAHDLGAALSAVSARTPDVAVVGHLVGDDPFAASERLRASGVASIVVLAANDPAVPPRAVPRDTEVVREPLDLDALAARIHARMTPSPEAPTPGWVVEAVSRAQAGAAAERGATPPPDPGLFDALDDGVALIDHEGRIVWANEALGRLFGVVPAALRGEFLHALVPAPGTPLPGDPSDPDAAWMAATGRHAHGSTLAVDVRLRIVAAYPDRQALVTVRDAGPRQLVEQITRANSDLNEQLRRSQKIGALGRLAGGVAHDFNNLLQVIGGYAEALGVDRLDRASRQRVLDSIHNATDRASSLTRQLLAFGRRQVLVPRVLDLNATVRSLEHMLTRVIGEDVTLVVSLSPDLRAVRVDAGQIEQVVLNLAINARDAMLDGGTLEIATVNLQVEGHYAPPELPVPIPPGPWVQLVVRDTGSGMDADTAAQAFEPFFTTKDASRGSGLGLSMVYGIVKQSGGYTWIESAPAAGTTVHVLLPAVDAAVEPETADALTPLSTNVAVSGTVLLVEDDPEVRALFATFLRHAGYDVLEAADGREALEVFERRGAAVDLVVTDVVMPNVSGPALAGALRARRPDVKLLYVSGYSEQVESGPGEPGAVHLPKPVTRTVLLRQVAALLARSRLQ